MDAREFIARRFGLDLNQPSPIEIPNTGRSRHLAPLFHDLGFKVGAEIGVLEGNFSECICIVNPGIELYCVDSWINYDGYYFDGVEEAEQKARERLKNYNCHILHMTSMEALSHIPDKSLDFVYIDGNHEFPYVAMDVAFWSKKVKTGGIVSGHDYSRGIRPRSNMHVPYVLSGYMEAYNINPLFVFGREAKIAGERRDTRRSWMWVKP